MSIFSKLVAFEKLADFLLMTLPFLFGFDRNTGECMEKVR